MGDVRANAGHNLVQKHDKGTIIPDLTAGRQHPGSIRTAPDPRSADAEAGVETRRRQSEDAAHDSSRPRAQGGASNGPPSPPRETSAW